MPLLRVTATLYLRPLKKIQLPLIYEMKGMKGMTFINIFFLYLALIELLAMKIIQNNVVIQKSHGSNTKLI